MPAIWATVLTTCLFAYIDLIRHSRGSGTDGPRLKLLITSAIIFGITWGMFLSLYRDDRQLALLHGVGAGLLYLAIVGGGAWFRRRRAARRNNAG